MNDTITRAIIAASQMPPRDARNVLLFICGAGMTTEATVPQPTPGQIHFAKREKFIDRMKGATDRVLEYARHETLRKVEKHFRGTQISSAEGDPPKTLSARLAFDKTLFAEELLAALREEGQSALQVAAQQLFDEIGSDSVWRVPAEVATGFLDTRANLLANASDEMHAEVMDTIQQGLEHGESRKELMSRINTAMDGIKKSRAETIANTETAAAFNFARDKAMREAGVTHKKWLHSQSPLIQEPRPTHVDADGQTRAIDEPFDIGGVSMMHPGDESAGPEEVINCHCVAIPVEAPIASGEAEGHPFRGNQYTAGKHDDELREDLGVSKDKLDAYEPTEKIRKIGKHWTFETVDGQEYPDVFSTKKQATEAAISHKILKQSQYERPSDYRDISSVRARKQLVLINKYMSQGMSEMEAGHRARQEIPDAN